MIRSIQRRFSTSVNLVTTPLQVFQYPGARVLTLNSAQESNPLSKDILDSIGSRLDGYQNNGVVEIVLINSASAKKFSKGVDPRVSTNYSADVNAINELNKKLGAYVKPTLVVYEGDVQDGGYSAFSSCKFRLGTENTTFSVKGLLNGYIPLGGGLINHLLAMKRDGVTLAKFLPLTGWEVKADEMYGFGMLTHVVQTQPHHILFQTLSNTQPESYKSKAYQNTAVQIESLKVYLDLMHVGCEELDDLLDHPLWSKALLVPPNSEDTQYSVTNEITMENVTSLNIADFRREMLQCFNAPTFEDCKKRLEKSASNVNYPQKVWAEHCLQQVNKIDPELAKQWFNLLEQNGKQKIESVIVMEQELAKQLQK